MSGRGEGGGDAEDCNIVFEVVKEVDKELVWIDASTVSISQASNNDPATVLKLVRKREVNILCPQHNPVRIKIVLSLITCANSYVANPCSQESK
jgi:hypothetical protein